MKFKIILFTVISGVIIVGCSDDQVCIPGKTEFCACTGGMQGAQVCNGLGSGYESCVCPDTNESDVQNDEITEEIDSLEEEHEPICEDLDGDDHAGFGEGCDSESDVIGPCIGNALVRVMGNG